MPKVTVIMATYNCKDYQQLKKSVMSIINRSYTDWDMIIYNDGSTDQGKTSRYIKKYRI